MARETGDRLAVWDLPTRIFHWALLVAVCLAWWSESAGDLNLHRTIGAIVAGLLVFRLWWGFFGSSTARFASFLKGPGAILSYLRGGEGRAEAPGHNPLGGWSVLAMIACLIVLVACGLFAVDVDGLESGPLSSFVSFETGRLASQVHGTAFQVLQTLVVLHLAAIVFYATFKRRDLVGPMVTGRGHAGAPMVPGSAAALGAGVMFGAAATTALLYFNGAV